MTELKQIPAVPDGTSGWKMQIKCSSSFTYLSIYKNRDEEVMEKHIGDAVLCLQTHIPYKIHMN
jgi:hypothetical protein